MDMLKNESCRELLKKFHTLPQANKYVLALITLIINNSRKFQRRSIHSRSQYNLSAYQGGVYDVRIKLYKLPHYKIKSLSTNSKQFKVPLKELLLTHLLLNQ
jgi:hypothetical protein